MIEVDAPIHLDCPICGAQPTEFPVMWGEAYYFACSNCGWEGETRDIGDAREALEYWDNKVEEYLNKGEERCLIL